ncbi:hypothetical protein [Candidatus Methylopumilus planktonicus]|uniref:hypothetical protein n=1 Tax=Candidatus Methylopumilus planktonicus TaxID=1581557 RepID=UPI003BEF439A
MSRWIVKEKKIFFIESASVIPESNLTELELKNIKNFYLRQQSRLIVFFGFVYPMKGVDLLFSIANPEIDKIVIIGNIDFDSDYTKLLFKFLNGSDWYGKSTITGHLSATKVSNLLRVADAVILPFRNGCGEWNSSLHAARLNNAFVISTSNSASGYNAVMNTYFAEIDNIQEMRTALDQYCKNPRKYSKYKPNNSDQWRRIANQHESVYKEVLAHGKFKSKN